VTKPVTKSDIRDQYANQISAMVDTAQAMVNIITGTGDPQQPVVQMTSKVGDWDGDVLDVTNFNIPFDRSEVDTDLKDSVSDKTSPGTVADLSVTTAQGDWLGMCQRSFHLRHASRTRQYLAAASRLRGLSHDGGPLNRGVLGRVASFLRRGRKGASA